MKNTGWMEAATFLYVLLALVALLAVLWGLFWLFRKVFRALSGKGTLFGGDARARLGGLAVTAILFTPLLNLIARGVASFAVGVVERVPRQALVQWRTHRELCESAPASGCEGDSLLVLLRAVGAGIGSAFRESGLLSVGLGYVIFALALWVLATHALHSLTTRKQGEERIGLRDLLLDDDFEITRKNGLFFLILALGSYLSLASIAAIPDLREERGGTRPGGVGDTTKFTRFGVSQRIDATQDSLPDPLAMADSVFNPGASRYARGTGSAGRALAPSGRLRLRTGSASGAASGQPEAAPAAAADSARQAAAGPAAGTPAGDSAPAAAPVQQVAAADSPGVATAAGTAGDTAGGDTVPRISPAIPPAQVAALHGQVLELRRLWTDQAVRHDSAVRRVARELAQARQLAQAAYMGADTTRRLRALHTYSFRLERWLLHAQFDLQAEQDRSWIALRRLHRRLDGWTTGVVGYLTGPTADTARFAQLQREAVRLRAEEWLAVERPPVPLRPLPERGEGLGPFQYVSGWLLKTDSMPLTLIVGMLGFGLLGAAASTFVREQTRREHREARLLRSLLRQRGDPAAAGVMAADLRAPGDHSQPLKPVQPLVQNLASVVIRGGSAAIVVFLGIMGGLSVLAQEADPNPYALLFTCLVGAVFSEKVWEWAEERFGLNLGDSDDDDDGDAGGRNGGGSGGDGNGNGGGDGDADGVGNGDGGNGDRPANGGGGGKGHGGKEQPAIADNQGGGGNPGGGTQPAGGGKLAPPQQPVTSPPPSEKPRPR